MKQINAILGGASNKVHIALPNSKGGGSSPSLVASSSVVSPEPPAPSPRCASGRIGPIESMREREAPVHVKNRPERPSSFTKLIESSKQAIVNRLPTMKRVMNVVSSTTAPTGDRTGRRTSSGRLISRSPSNRRIRRRDFHFVPAAPTPEKLKKMRWVIMPRSNWKVRWDLWIGFIILYSVIAIPYRIGFAVDLKDWEQIVNYMFDASFATDVVFNFFTGYFDEDVFIYDLSKIRMRYIKSWFIFDLLSTLPMDQFFQAVTSPTDPSLLSFKLLRTIRLVRLLKLMRLLRLKRAVETIQMDALNAHVLQTLKSLMMIIFIIHLIACAWYMFYTWDPSGVNWVTYINPDGVRNPYLVCFYWVANTMMSVGYGDIYGITDGERLFSVFVECLGSVSVGLIIANIQMLTENYNPRGVKMKQRIHETKEFLLKRCIPRRMRQRVISQFEYHWSRRTVFDEDQLLHHFPKSLQYEILAASMESFVKKFPVFGMTSVDFFVFTIPRMRPIVVGPGQTVVEAESVWEELYFILSGSLEAMRGNVVASSLAGGDICGIEYLVGSRRRYVHSYVSSSKTELYAIYSADLIEGMEHCVIATKYLQDLSSIIATRYADAAKRGRKAMQKQESSQHRASIELFLQYRHRRSPSYGNILQATTSDDIKRFHLSMSDDIQLHWTLIRHYSRTRISWDTIMGIVVVWTTISVPFRISFNIADTLFLKCTDRLSDGLFLLDIVFNFFTTYLDETGVEIVDRHEIRKHYLKRSFFVDVISTIPFDFLVETITASGDFRSLKLFRTIKLVKLLRLVRIMKIFKLNSQRLSELDISMDTVRLLKLLAPVLTIGHYVGCFWYYMSADHDAKEAWWGRIYFDDPDSVISKYIASVYWATTTMATVGFGDIYAVNSYEQMYSILVMIGGTTLFAYVIGTVIEVVSNSKSLMNREHEMGQRINAYIKERGVSHEFFLACQEHLRYLNIEKTLFYEQGLFDALSHSLRSELILYLNSSVLSQIRFFDKKPKWFLTLLLPRLVPQYFLQGDLLIYHGNLSSGIFFLMSGTVVARVPQTTNHGVDALHGGSGNGRSERSSISGPKKSKAKIISVATSGRIMDAVPDEDGTIATLHEGEFFGYKEVLTHTAAQYNVFACIPTGTYMLPREFLDAISELYPDVLEEMRGLFLHSITKQQTILHHWHNNDIMGISGTERYRILRANTHAEYPGGCRPPTLEGLNTDSVSEAIEGAAPNTEDVCAAIASTQEPRLCPISGQQLDRVMSATIIINNPVRADTPDISSARQMSSSRQPSRSEKERYLPDTEGCNTEQQVYDGPTQEALPSEELQHEIAPTPEADSAQQLSQGAERPSLSQSNSTVRLHRTPSLYRGASSRRSSLLVPKRSAPATLLRYPSMPEEINALVSKLLEVEGYVSPTADTGEEKVENKLHQ